MIEFFPLSSALSFLTVPELSYPLVLLAIWMCLWSFFKF